MASGLLGNVMSDVGAFVSYPVRHDVIIDDVGLVYAAGSWDLVQRHDAAGCDYDLESYLIRNCGHVRLRRSARGVGTHVTFRPGYVRDRSIRAAIEMLQNHPTSRYILDLVGDDPQIIMVTDVDDVVSAISTEFGMVSEYSRPVSSVQRLPMRRLYTDGRLAPLRKLHRRWINTHRCLSSIGQALTIENAGAQQLAARIVNGAPIVEAIGSGYSNLREPFGGTTVRRVDELPDAAYGRWIAKSLVRAAYRGKPTLHLVEATIALPGRPPVRVRYERLLLPWFAKREVAISSASVTRSAVRLAET